jgi:hypothetical protein
MRRTVAYNSTDLSAMEFHWGYYKSSYPAFLVQVKASGAHSTGESPSTEINDCGTYFNHRYTL